MKDINLVALLREYEQKKLHAERALALRLELLHNQYPRLLEINNQINQIGFSSIRSILNDELSNNIPSLESLKKEKENLLISLNIDPNSLKPKYECSLCSDTGYIQTSQNKTTQCSCLKQQLLDVAFDNSNLNNVHRENFTTFNEAAFSDQIHSKTNLSPKQNILNIRQHCLAFIDTFDDSTPNSLLFSGNTGLGKTFISNCIAYELLNKGKTVLYQTAPILIENVIAYKMAKIKPSHNIYHAALTSDLLIIDDLGTEHMNAMKLSELFNLINSRILDCKKTIISTNLSISEIFQLYEERIGSRIAGYYSIYSFFGNDIRLNKYKK